MALQIIDLPGRKHTPIGKPFTRGSDSHREPIPRWNSIYAVEDASLHW